MNILGIETSCDETSAAVVRDGSEVLSNVVLSQIELHSPYGGVVPEIASRTHVEHLPAVVDRAVEDAGLEWSDIDGVASTYGPGLSSSIMIGLSTGKALSMRLKKPFYAVDHIRAHIYSAFLGDGVRMEDSYPFAALVVSGGHTLYFRVDETQEKLLGQTIDDAAGEAFDKAASLLGLGYPGGPVIDKISKEADKTYVKFPRIKIKARSKFLQGFDPEMCCSFSGLKTALMYYLKDNPLDPGDEQRRADIAASFQEAVIDVLVDKAERACEGLDTMVVGGGVSLNSRLRERLSSMTEEKGVKLLLAKPAHCGDNAAMIAGYASTGKSAMEEEALQLDATPNINYAERRMTV
ncbi:tRNA (adenosine(37)-N6)-threonylcarbamoyltransferase complex transferase subunit TsaD [bacterium E08(2017)]|nr:tRNA (adenosine(37)-N6)-threonylcarbamoyltransferase complex transferase subunit TsaD [bacterium E08(2017)]